MKALLTVLLTTLICCLISNMSLADTTQTPTAGNELLPHIRHDPLMRDIGDGTYDLKLSEPNITEENRFGYNVANADDVNNDGIDDLIVGAPSHPVSGVR